MKVLLSGNEAIARGAYEAGSQMAFGYPGTPGSEILENVARYQDIYSEWSTNEKVAPVLCPGCPQRASYYFLSKMKAPVAGDIGCYNLGALPPYSARHTMGSMGASIGVRHGMAKSGLPEKPFATIGDSTFFHAGVPPRRGRRL